MVCLEAKEKRGSLLSKYQYLSPEVTSGIYNAWFFWWLNPLFLRGYKKALTVDQLFCVDAKLAPGDEARGLLVEWRKCKCHSLRYSRPDLLTSVNLATRREKPNSLFYMSIAYHGRSFASGILPRLCATGFNFSQPFLIKRVIDYLSDPNSHENTKQIGHALIGAYCVVYVGFSVSRMPGSTLAPPLAKPRTRYPKRGTNTKRIVV